MKNACGTSVIATCAYDAWSTDTATSAAATSATRFPKKRRPTAYTTSTPAAPTSAVVRRAHRYTAFGFVKYSTAKSFADARCPVSRAPA